MTDETTTPQTTTYKNVQLTRRGTVPHTGGQWDSGRTQVGARVLRRVTAAMKANHTVAMRTYYNEKGEEFMDAEITWDGGPDI